MFGPQRVTTIVAVEGLNERILLGKSWQIISGVILQNFATLYLMVWDLNQPPRYLTFLSNANAVPGRRQTATPCSAGEFVGKFESTIGSRADGIPGLVGGPQGSSADTVFPAYKK